MKLEKAQILDVFLASLAPQKSIFLKATFSDPETPSKIKRVSVRPVVIKKLPQLQWESFGESKAFHRNLSLLSTDLIRNELQTHLEFFQQIIWITEHSTWQIRKSKTKYIAKIVKNEAPRKTSSHDREKNYLLPEGKPVDFLISLGIMNEQGMVHKNKYDKFRQINKYLEFIDGTFQNLLVKSSVDKQFKCVDFGCGKSYLTFALAHYLKQNAKIFYKIFGLDLKDDVIDSCNNLAAKLSYENISFLKGDIRDFHQLDRADLVFSLHACDNATDYAIAKALDLQAKAILLVPCCQHELYQNFKKNKNGNLSENFAPFVQDGILMEKFLSLTTDAFRAQALRLCGYHVQVMEFIDMEHTPKNILIKAVRTTLSETQLRKIKKEYLAYKKFLGIEPLLDRLIQSQFLC
jgi:SAM-dependent methyltransferase